MIYYYFYNRMISALIVHTVLSLLNREVALMLRAIMKDYESACFKLNYIYENKFMIWIQLVFFIINLCVSFYYKKYFLFNYKDPYIYHFFNYYPYNILKTYIWFNLNKTKTSAKLKFTSSK
jgi:hypothetical protein